MSKAEAKELEPKAIASERPLYNTLHHPEKPQFFQAKAKATRDEAKANRLELRKKQKVATKLTLITVAHAKPEQRDGKPVRTEIHDRGCPGLFLIIQPSGAKSWAFRYRVGGKSRKLTIGGTGEVSLQNARMATYQAQQQIKAGRDPAVEKQHLKQCRLGSSAASSAVECTRRAPRRGGG
jgi:Arm DNA-binding domain